MLRKLEREREVYTMGDRYFREQPVPQTLNQRDTVEWVMLTARESDEPLVSSSTFVYDFGIPRISAHIFNMREDLWEIETIKKGRKHYYKLLQTPREILEQAKTERLFT